MQLSSRVIKHINVDETGSRSILTKNIPIKVNKNSKNNLSNSEVSLDKDSEEEKRYKNIANMILEEARRKSEAIILKANIDAKNIEEEAHNKGYSRGYNEGQDKGYSDGLERGELEASKIKEEVITSAQEDANDIIFSAKEEYEAYLLNKKEEIKLLMLQISESLFKEKISDFQIIEKAIFEAIEASKNTENFIIKANKEICSKLKNSMEKYKETLTFSTEVHIVNDVTIENNKVVIEKNNGKTIIDFNEAYNSIDELIKNLKYEVIL